MPEATGYLIYERIILRRANHAIRTVVVFIKNKMFARSKKIANFKKIKFFFMDTGQMTCCTNLKSTSKLLENYAYTYHGLRRTIIKVTEAIKPCKPAKASLMMVWKGASPVTQLKWSWSMEEHLCRNPMIGLQMPFDLHCRWFEIFKGAAFKAVRRVPLEYSDSQDASEESRFASLLESLSSEGGWVEYF